MSDISTFDAADPTPTRGWAVVALGFSMVLISAGAVFYSFGVFISEFVETFKVSYAVANIPLTVALAVSGAAAIPVGWLSERMALRKLALIGIAGAALGLALVSIAQSMTQVIIIYIVLIGSADVLLGMMLINMLIVQWFERRRGLAIGIAATGASVAVIVFPPFAQLLSDAFGWRMVFLIFAALILALAPAVWWLGRPPMGGIPAWERWSHESFEEQDAVARISFASLLRRKDFWLIVVGISALKAYNAGVMGAMIPFVVQSGIDKLSAAQLVSLTGAVALLSKIGCGALLDRFDSRWILRMALVSGAASMAMLSALHGMTAYSAAAVLYGISLGAMLPVWGSLTAQCFPGPNYGRALGLTRAAMTPINVVPILLGWLYDSTGDYRTGWVLLGATAVFGLFISFGVRQEGRAGSSPIRVRSD